MSNIVCLAFPQQDGQTGVAIKDAFLQLGWKVLTLDSKLEGRLLYDFIKKNYVPYSSLFHLSILPSNYEY